MEYIGYIKYQGPHIKDGLFGAREAAVALNGFDEVFRYFLAKEEPEFAKLKYDVLENYLVVNYQEIFGTQYDRVIVQVKLLLNLSLDDRDRRLDILLHNKETDDWEIFELKKANAKITRKSKGIVCFCANVTRGLAQLRHYEEHLKLTEVKKQLFDKYKIKYLVPKFHLIIGRELSDDFRKCASREKDVEIKTYETVYREMKCRFDYFDDFLRILAVSQK